MVIFKLCSIVLKKCGEFFNLNKIFDIVKSSMKNKDKI